MPTPLEILFEDAELLVALKPHGLPTQSPRQFDSLEQRVRAHLAEQAGSEPASVYLGLPHRLDRAVSGVILLAKTPRAARKLSRQFERRRVRKIYWAGVEGVVEPAAGEWADFMRKIPEKPRSEIVAESHRDAQQALLRYRMLGATPLGSRLEIELVTGRMHQIRLQAASRGHPVIGDALYGSRHSFGPQPVEERERAVALHAHSIQFHHPQTQESLTITAPPPAVWEELQLAPHR